jgi:hypothetical protein
MVLEEASVAGHRPAVGAPSRGPRRPLRAILRTGRDQHGQQPGKLREERPRFGRSQAHGPLGMRQQVVVEWRAAGPDSSATHREQGHGWPDPRLSRMRTAWSASRPLAARFIARGLEDVDLYILAGSLGAVFFAVRYMLFRGPRGGR